MIRATFSKARETAQNRFGGSLDPSLAQLRALALASLLVVSAVAFAVPATADYTQQSDYWEDDFTTYSDGETPDGWSSGSYDSGIDAYVATGTAGETQQDTSLNSSAIEIRATTYVNGGTDNKFEIVDSNGDRRLEWGDSEAGDRIEVRLHDDSGTTLNNDTGMTVSNGDEIYYEVSFYDSQNFSVYAKNNNTGATINATLSSTTTFDDANFRLYTETSFEDANLRQYEIGTEGAAALVGGDGTTIQVLNNSGGGISNATVTISNSSTGDEVFNGTTDADGNVSAVIRTDEYDVEISHPDYFDKTFANETLVAGESYTYILDVDPRRLVLRAPRVMEPDNQYPFHVWYYDENGDRDIVTQNATIDIESITFDGNPVLTETTVDGSRVFDTNDNESTNATVNVTATYNPPNNPEVNTTEEFVVASIELKNLQILPGASRGQAIIRDDAIFFLLIVALLSIVFTRVSTAFGGLAMSQAVIAIGWFGNYMGDGITMVSVFAAIFIGLNLAGNVDYTVSR